MSAALFDKNTAMMVIAGLFHDPTLLHDQESVRLTLDDFANDFYQIVFGSIYNLVMEGGLESLTPVDIDFSIARHSRQSKIFQDNNGMKFLQEVNQLSKDFDHSKFMMHYERLKKLTLLRDLESNGISTKSFYNPNVSVERRSEQERKLNEATPDEILREVWGKLNKVEEKYVSRNYASSQTAAKGIRDLYFELKANPEIGPPLQGEIFNYLVRGARPGKVYMNSAPTGHGKALVDTDVLPTFYDGEKQVGEIKIGDYLIGRDGKPTQVLGVYPQGELETFKITFRDGRTAMSSADHLWTVIEGDPRYAKEKTLTLQEIIDSVEEKGYQNRDGSFRFRIPVNKAVEWGSKELSIDPYVLGLFLGDGSFREQETNKGLAFTTKDVELVKEIEKRTGWTSVKNKGNKYSYTFKKHKDDYNNIQIKDFLAGQQDLINTYSYEKFIPEAYKKSSIEQRFDLLRGLMDSDGTSYRNRIKFTTTSERLKNDFVEILWSLGYFASAHKDERGRGTYEVQIGAPLKDRPKFFSLQRKIEKIDLTKRSERYEHNAIVNIESMNENHSMTCFAVDNDDKLFLMNDFIVTHNTRMMLGNAASLSVPYLNEAGEVVKREDLHKILFVTTEQQADEIQTLLLAFVSGVNEKKILYGTATKEEEKKIKAAIDIIEHYEDNFMIEAIPDPSIALVRAKLTKHIIQNGVNFIFYDYIFSSPGLITEFSAARIREDVALMMLSNTIKEVGSTFNVFIESSTQLNERWENSKVRNQNHIRGSKAIADKIDVGSVSVKLNALEEEEEAIRLIAEEASLRMPNIVMDIYKNRRGEGAGLKLYRYFDHGTCRATDIMLTDQQLRIVKDYDALKYNVETVGLMDILTGGLEDE